MKDLPFDAHYATAVGLGTAGSVWIKEHWDFARIKQELNPSAAFLNA
jgi:hypothetical protein